MKYLAPLVLALGLIIGYHFAPLTIATAAVPPRPEQPRPDIFPIPGLSNPQTANPVTVKAKAQRTASYRLLLMPSCVSGTIPNDLVAMAGELQRVNFTLVRNDFAYDFTIRINCGSEQIRICGAVNVFCLGRGFPYNPDVEISDILSQYQAITRVAILCHEICGHAIGTWNEQYAVCGASCGFAPTPNWPDFMNTGEQSRHGMEVIEQERWDRTMYPVLFVDPCHGEDNPANGTYWNLCIQRLVYPSGWSWDPVTGVWFNPAGVPEWGECSQVSGGCWNLVIQRWVARGSLLYNPVTNIYSSPPI